MTTRLRAAVVGAVAVMALAAGCGTTASDLPLPGSSMPGPTYRVTVTFDDALNLAVGAPVKINGVSVGRVKSISVKDLKAVVALDIAESTTVHSGADFRLRSTTALGELFVDVVDDPASTATLADGDTVDLEHSSAAPTVEDTLSAASLFINGGGLGQIQTIVDETNLLVGGREDTLRDVMQRITSTAAAVTSMSSDIDAALIALADASQVLNDRQATIDRALVEVAPAAQVLEENTAALVDLLSSTSNLSTVVVPLLEQSRADLLQIVAQAGPVFDQVASIEDRIDAGVAEISAFVDGLGAAVPGSYLNTALVFSPSVSIGDTPILPPLALPETTQETTPSPNAPATPTTPAAPNGAAGLANLLGLLTGGAS